MAQKKRFTPAYFFASLFAITLCTAQSNAPLNAAEKSKPSYSVASSRSWLPENSTVNTASSTDGRQMNSAESYLVAEGKASYYSKNFHGKSTASGESFNRNHFTAAHRTLPFGTSVKVINLDNGKNVVVRINDRGPHMKGRIIDVSPAAAREIGLFGNGTAHVRIEAYD